MNPTNPVLRRCNTTRAMFFLLLGAVFLAVFAPPAPAGQTVTVTTDADFVYGNGQLPNGAAPADQDPNGNTVTVEAGSVTGGVYGGYTAKNGSGAVTLQASSNQVTVSGGSVLGVIAGGAVDYDIPDDTVIATGNTITLIGAPKFGDATELYGGRADSQAAGGDDLFTGNTLNMQTDAGLWFGADVGNFETINFTLQPDVANGAVLLNAAEVALGNGSGKNTVINLALADGADLALAEGESVVLISATNALTGAYDAGTLELSGRKKAYTFALSAVSAQINATLQSVKTYATVSPQTAAFQKTSPADVKATLTPGSFTFLTLKNGEDVLMEGTDFTEEGGAVTVKQSYLAGLANGTQTLTFEMSGGVFPTLAVTVSDGTAPGPGPSPAPGGGGSSNCSALGASFVLLFGLAFAVKKR